jgi:hypothetical protein
VDDSRQGRIGRTQVEELDGRGAAMELPSARATGMCTSAPSLAFLSAGHRLRPPPPPNPFNHPTLPPTHTYIIFKSSACMICATCLPLQVPREPKFHTGSAGR